MKKEKKQKDPSIIEQEKLLDEEKQLAKMEERQLKRKKGKLTRRKYRSLFWFLIPAIVLAIVFNYVPMAGILLAFKRDFNMFIYDNPFDAFVHAPWCGTYQFDKLFRSDLFLKILGNTLVISILKIVITFPIPIFLAIFVCELRGRFLPKLTQSVMYLPHFLSWAVITGIFMSMLDPETGIMRSLFGDETYYFGEAGLFKGLVVFTSGWKEVGWSAITYIAAILAIDPALYEVAELDGANKWKQIMYITIPQIAPTIAMLFIIRLGHIMDAGFDQVFTMLNPLVQDTGEIIGTYVYRIGMGQGDYSFSTAVGLFNSVIALALILTGNAVCKKLFHQSIW